MNAYASAYRRRIQHSASLLQHRLNAAFLVGCVRLITLAVLGVEPARSILSRSGHPANAAFYSILQLNHKNPRTLSDAEMGEQRYFVTTTSVRMTLPFALKRTLVQTLSLNSVTLLA